MMYYFFNDANQVIYTADLASDEQAEKVCDDLGVEYFCSDEDYY